MDEAAPGGYLGVSRSLSGRCWIERDADPRLSLALAQRLDLPDVLGRVLAGRGVGLEEAQNFLDPTLRDLLPDPSAFKDMDAAATRLAAAVMQGEPIVVYGDYDVDGATSSALLQRFLQTTGGRSRIYIPDRLKEGYGPNVPALQEIAAAGTAVVVTVDCGTTAHDPLAAARDLGLDVIVIDHHEPEPHLPAAVAVVNPKRFDEDAGHTFLAAVGLTFLLVVATNRVLRGAGWFADGRAEPDLKQWLDIVALGTVCDVVPLKGLNRAFVCQGLKVMAQRRNKGMAALADVARIDRAPEAYHLGYVLGPRVNAGGRVGQSWLGARLLAGDDAGECADFARRLDDFNRERQEIERHVQAAAMAQIEAAATPPAALVFVAGEGWHPGVVGIVASRLVDRYGVPACVVGIDNGEAVGSGRSVAGIDLGAAVIAARQAGLLSRGGGHAMAAGFSTDASRLEGLIVFLRDAITRQIGARPIQAMLKLDGALAVRGATMELATNLERLSPYGSANAEPRFALANVYVQRPMVVGENHLRCRLTDSGKGSLNAIAFRAMDNEIGPALLDAGTVPLHVAGRLRVNRWQGRETAQLMVDDVARI